MSMSAVRRSTDNPQADYTGKYVKIMDRAGNVWFQGKAVERVGTEAYRFVVLRIGGRSIEAEMVATMRELVGASRAVA